ncbi:hypothetical protein [Streptomyces sp. NPDC046727]|uniref:hypothetical protein n=1 Tax=Streptomyces sp. NPDC046727 TaxID=3155373 RepID=UPI0033D88C93
MVSALVWFVRLCGLAGWGSAAVACGWLLGAAPMSRPWDGPLVWGGVAAGCAAVRVLALWALRLIGEDGAPGWKVSLKKGTGRRDVRNVRHQDVWRRHVRWRSGRSFGLAGSALWVKGRTALVWLLVAFAAGAMFACLMSMGSGRIDELRDAGAEVATARVVGDPLRVRAERDDEDQVKGYASRLVVAVDGGAGRLTVKGAYTYDKPREGTRVRVLWAPSAPGLGGYVNESRDLPTLAAGRWQPFADDELGGAALFAFVLVAVIGGLVMAPVFSLAADEDSLEERAWSAPWQTVRGLFVVGQYLAWRPILLGQEAHWASFAFAGGGFVLVLLVYAFTTAF